MVDDQLFEAAREGDVVRLATLLDAHPDKLDMRDEPHGWTLLHRAAHGGHVSAVDLLLGRGIDPNVRERGDDTYPMHWAAAAGHLDVVRRLADAGGDVIGKGDDHELEVIGWATCWVGTDTDAHRAVAELLLSRGARHHIFSAIAMNLHAEVRRLAGQDPSMLTKRMSRNESRALPLHFAVRMNRPQMVTLLLELGADPAATDDGGMTAAVYAADPQVGLPVLEALAAGGAVHLFLALALGDDATAVRLFGGGPESVRSGGANAGALHMLAKRGDLRGVRWLLERGADPNARWSHRGANVTPLHLAAAQGHIDVVRALLAAGGDPAIRDSEHDGDAAGWAEYGRVPASEGWRAVVEVLRGSGPR